MLRPLTFSRTTCTWWPVDSERDAAALATLARRFGNLSAPPGLRRPDIKMKELISAHGRPAGASSISPGSHRGVPGVFGLAKADVRPSVGATGRSNRYLAMI